MASDRTIHPLTLEVLFGPEGIVADENGDGYPDRLKLCVCVEPGLADAAVWAQVLNLAARLAGEVTALDPPVVKALNHVSAGGAVFVVHKPLKNHPVAAELWRAGRAVHLFGSSAVRMAEVLYSLAVHSDPARGLRRPWSSMRVAEAETLMMDAFDRRGKRAGRFHLAPVRPAAEKSDVERFDLLDLGDLLPRLRRKPTRPGALFWG